MNDWVTATYGGTRLPLHYIIVKCSYVYHYLGAPVQNILKSFCKRYKKVLNTAEVYFRINKVWWRSCHHTSYNHIFTYLCVSNWKLVGSIYQWRKLISIKLTLDNLLCTFKKIFKKRHTSALVHSAVILFHWARFNKRVMERCFLFFEFQWLNNYCLLLSLNKHCSYSHNY